PVMKGDKTIGAIDEESLLQALPKFLGNPKKFYDTKVDKMISTYFPIVPEETGLDEVINLLSRGHKGVLVSNKEGRIVGIITKIDVLNALGKR
ncbi:MAG: CBS domain-containing protein, partial [Thermoproteota archaeon]